MSTQLYLAHVARKKETKTKNANAPLIQYRLGEKLYGKSQYAITTSMETPSVKNPVS